MAFLTYYIQQMKDHGYCKMTTYVILQMNIAMYIFSDKSFWAKMIMNVVSMRHHMFLIYNGKYVHFIEIT